MISVEELKAILTEWRNTYGEPRVSQKYGNTYPAIPIKDRKPLLRYLVEIIKKKGEEKFFFSKDHVKNAIAAECFPPDVYDVRARRKGYNAVWTELAQVVCECWPDADVVEVADNIKNIKVAQVPVLHENPFKELDRSTLKNVPVTQDDVDPEMDKLLGFSDE